MLQLLIYLIIAGVILYVIGLIPMDGWIKRLARVLVVAVVLILALKFLFAMI